MKRFLLVALLALVGCRSLPFPEPELEGEYGKALQRATRKATVYQGLEARAFVRVVWLSPWFVEQQAKKISEMRAEPPPIAAQRLQRMRDDISKGPTFFAVVHTPDNNWNDWEKKDSVWRIALDTGAGEVTPERVERIEKPFNAELQALYPYLDEYSIGYILHFAQQPSQAAPSGGGVVSAAASSALQGPRLVVAGVLGKMDFHWND